MQTGQDWTHHPVTGESRCVEIVAEPSLPQLWSHEIYRYTHRSLFPGISTVTKGTSSIGSKYSISSEFSGLVDTWSEVWWWARVGERQSGLFRKAHLVVGGQSDTLRVGFNRFGYLFRVLEHVAQLRQAQVTKKRSTW